jgi:hypothetical protein
MSGSFDAGLVPLYTTQFSTNLELLLQQKGSKLRGKVREGFHVGKQASPINQLGAVVLRAPKGRFSPLDHEDNSYVRRWVFPQAGDLPQLVDTFDELQTIVDPKSALVEAAANAVGRAWDDNIIYNAFATAQLGQDASLMTSETFNTADTTAATPGFRIADNFAASSSTGMTVAKLIEAKRVFEHYHNDLDSDSLTLVMGSKQASDMLNQVQFVSTEFNDKPVLVDGRVTRFMGFDIVISERLATVTSADTSATCRNCIAFVKSGLYLGIWKDMENRIDQRVDLTGIPWQVYTMAMYGSTRLQPGKVLSILSNDSTGSDITP